MRVAAAGIIHETNTFAPRPTLFEDFVAWSGGDPEFPAASLEARFRGTDTTHGGVLQAADRLGVEVVPILVARAMPGGPSPDAAYGRMKALLLDRLRAALPVDGVVLELHGAMVTESLEDAEGDLIGAVRSLVGPDLPVVATLDFHANVTAAMARGADALAGYDTYPHVDMRERGAEALDLAAAAVAGRARPVTAYRQLPLLTLPPMQCTLRAPMAGLALRVRALERAPGIILATLAMGFPFADIRDAGCAVLVTADGDRALAERSAEALAREVFDRRGEFEPRLTSVEEAWRAAREARGGPVILADGSDNPGGGAPADGTVVLQRLLALEAEGAVVGILCDPETASQAHAAGAGAWIDAAIGGKTDDRHGAPVRARAAVQALSDGRFTYRGPMWRGAKDDLGRTAVLKIGGVEVVVAERRLQLLDPEMLRFVGIEPTERRLVAVKSAVHFRAAFGPIASAIFDADTPGVHRPDFSGFSYRRLRRPIYPLDPAAAWPGAGGRQPE